MSEIEYIIVGRDVGEARHHLVGGEFMDAASDPGGTPLDVIYIGKLMAQMSEREGGERMATAEEMEQIRRAMRVETVPPGLFTQAQEDAILENTRVDVLGEERTPGAEAASDINTRLLVVPADGTLKAALDQLQMPNPGEPFDPPLTYPVDKDLMLSHLLDQIVETAVNTPEPVDLQEMNWTAIVKHVADHLEEKLQAPADAGGVGQIDAYHRAVGIYATNMCR
jgi:hypothetical protein